MVRWYVTLCRCLTETYWSQVCYVTIICGNEILQHYDISRVHYLLHLQYLFTLNMNQWLRLQCLIYVNINDSLPLQYGLTFNINPFFQLQYWLTLNINHFFQLQYGLTLNKSQYRWFRCDNINSTVHTLITKNITDRYICVALICCLWVLYYWETVLVSVCQARWWWRCMPGSILGTVSMIGGGGAWLDGQVRYRADGTASWLCATCT